MIDNTIDPVAICSIIVGGVVCLTALGLRHARWSASREANEELAEQNAQLEHERLVLRRNLESQEGLAKLQAASAPIDPRVVIRAQLEKNACRRTKLQEEITSHRDKSVSYICIKAIESVEKEMKDLVVEDERLIKELLRLSGASDVVKDVRRSVG